MSLLAYNLTTAPLPLAAGVPIVTLPAASSAGARGPAFNVTGDLKGQLAPAFALLQAQQAALSKVAVLGSFAVAGPNVTMTDTTGAFIANNIGQHITISGATTPANNGSFPVTAQTATTITYTNAAGVVEAYTGTYSLPGLVQYEWTALPEFNTFSLVVGSAQTDVSDLDVEIFADPGVLGDDANPGTQTQPVKTFQRAWTLGAVLGRRKRRIYLAAGTYPCTAPSPFQDNAFYCPAPIDEGEPLTVIGTPLDMLGVLTVNSASPNGDQITLAGPHAGLPMVGATMFFLDGPSAGINLQIKADDLTTFALCNSTQWTNATTPLPGDTFVVQRPGSILVTDTSWGFTGVLLGLKHIKIDVVSAGNSFLVLNNCQLQNIVNCEFASGTELAVDQNSIMCPGSLQFIYFDPPPFDYFLEAGSVYIHDSDMLLAANAFFGHAIGGVSCAVFENAFLSIERNSSLIMTEGGLALVNSNVQVGAVGNGCKFLMEGNDTTRCTWDGSLGGNALELFDGADARFLFADINNATGDAVHADGGCYVGAGDLGGTGNGGYGINLQAGSLAVANNDGGGNSACTVTGTGGVVLATTFTADPGTAGVVLDVTSTAGFPAAGFVKAGIEFILYTSLNPLQFLGCTRGANSTIASAHAIASSVSLASGFDVLVGAVPKAYAALPFGEVDGSGPTLNRFTIR